MHKVFMKYWEEKNGPRVAGKVMWGALRVILAFKRYYRKIFGRRRHLDDRLIF